MTDWEALGRAETEKHVAAFAKAVKAVERQIKKLAAGEEDEMKVRKAIDKLYDRAGKGEIRGDALANEACLGTIKDLIRQKNEAAEAGRVAVQKGRAAEISRLREEEREEKLGLSPEQRQYNKELALNYPLRRY